MSEIVVDLGDRVVTSAGEVVVSYEALVRLARNGFDIHSLVGVPDPLLDKYNKISSRPIRVWDPSSTTSVINKEWSTPEPFASMDLEEVTALALETKSLTSDEYFSRLAYELEEIDKRDMSDVFRHAAFLVSDFRSRGVVWGVGRGSSCACLVLFLIGLNSVDPVKYDIPPEEFFK